MIPRRLSPAASWATSVTALALPAVITDATRLLTAAPLTTCCCTQHRLLLKHDQDGHVHGSASEVPIVKVAGVRIAQQDGNPVHHKA